MRRVEAGTEHCYSWWLSFFLGDRAIAAISLSDAAIRKRLMDELKQQRWTHVHKLNVTVTDGVVDLWGFVQSESERQAIAVAAEAIPVVAVINDHLMREPHSFY